MFIEKIKQILRNKPERSSTPSVTTSQSASATSSGLPQAAAEAASSQASDKSPALPHPATQDVVDESLLRQLVDMVREISANTVKLD
jgi:hypothetical protein